MAADWLIIGGGVAGLTLAVTLAQQGISFLVLEQDKLAADAGAACCGRLMQRAFLQTLAFGTS